MSGDADFLRVLNDIEAELFINARRVIDEGIVDAGYQEFTIGTWPFFGWKLHTIVTILRKTKAAPIRFIEIRTAKHQL